MNKRSLVILLLAISLSSQNYVFAEEKASIEDKIIGSTFKALAKTFVAMADIDKLKKNNIDKLNKMDKEKFKKRYAEFYEVIKDLPVELKVAYGIGEAMAKEQAVRNIDSLNKKRIYEIVDSLPDTIITKQFKRYLSQTKQEIQKSNIVEKINKVWNKIVEKVNTPSPAPK